MIEGDGPPDLSVSSVGSNPPQQHTLLKDPDQVPSQRALFYELKLLGDYSTIRSLFDRKRRMPAQCPQRNKHSPRRTLFTVLARMPSIEGVIDYDYYLLLRIS